MTQHYANRPFLIQWFVLGMTTLLFGALLAFEFYQDRLDRELVERDRLRAQAQVMTANVGHLFRAAHLILQNVLDELPEWRNGVLDRVEIGKRWNAYLAMPGLRTLLVTDARGVVQYANHRTLIHKNFSHRPYFQRPRQRPDRETLFLSPPFLSVLNVLVMNLSRAIVGPNGEFAGVVSLSLEPAYFQTVMDSVLYAPDMQVTLAHGEGMLFLQRPVQTEPVDTAALASAPVAAVGTILYSTDGERIGVLDRIQPADLRMDKPLFVAVSRSVQAVQEGWYREMQLYGGLFGIMILLASLLLWVTQARLRRFDQLTRQTEKALKKSDLQQQAILNHTPAVVFMKDPQGRYLFINHQYETLLHVSNADVQGKTDYDLFPPEVAIKLQANDRLALSEGTIVVEEVVLQDDGLHTYLSVKFSLKESDGEPYAVCGIATNITDRKQMEEALRAAKEEALQASRTKSNFLAAMSHEIRTPMNAIIGMGDVLRESSLDAEQSRCLQMMINAGNTLMGLINDILDLSKIEAGQIEMERQPFDLPLLLTESVALLTWGATTRGIQLHLEVAEDLPRLVLGDAQRLKQVLFNLLDNGSKFTQEGQVSLIVSSLPASMIQFVVKDTGIGIPADRLSAIFEPFVQADSRTFKRFGGTGLGLSICQQLIILMGGTIKVESQPGAGTTFTFAIPLEQVTEESALDQVQPIDLLDGRLSTRAGLRILAVDDAEDNLRLLEAFLKSTPHELTTAEDGIRAVSLFQSNPFDLVLMDIQMPVMNGYEATRAIRQWEAEENRPATPIIAFTAHAMKEISDEILAAGCNDVLTKPIRKRALLSVLDRI